MWTFVFFKKRKRAALMAAIDEGDVGKVRAALRRITPNFVYTHPHGPTTPLLQAIRSARPDLVALLLHNNASPYTVPKDYEEHNEPTLSPLMEVVEMHRHAIENQQSQIVQASEEMYCLLRAKKADQLYFDQAAANFKMLAKHIFFCPGEYQIDLTAATSRHFPLIDKLIFFHQKNCQEGFAQHIQAMENDFQLAEQRKQLKNATAQSSVNAPDRRLSKM